MNLKKWLMLMLVPAGLLAAMFLYAVLFHAYRAAPVDKLRIASPPPQDRRVALVAAARGLKGVLYDQLKGGHNNIGGRLGFLVCIDVPRIAYAAAGVDLDSMLREDYKIHARFYPVEKPGNVPETPFFVRRVRNLYAYCRANGKLLHNPPELRAGDLIFPNTSHIVLVSEVRADGTISIIENAPWTNMTVEYSNSDKPRDVCRILD
ncbi:MAG: DUF1287 domain-containing protein [Elusimicrobia bacterium]|nr:DUF1287 domain-containing protein [Elusimicrobiota bacterium]